MTLIYLDGQWLDRETAKVSVFDHGFLYGDGVFEGMRVYGGRTFRLREHIERLYDSAKAILLTPPISQQEMVAPMLELARDIGQLIGVIEPMLEAKQKQTLGSSGVLIGQQAKMVEKPF